MAREPALMKTPRTVNVEITGRCNLRCLYCSHFDGPGDVSGDLPAAEWLRFFEELNRCTVMSVTLSGGEPFVRSDIRDILDGIVRNRMRYTVLSNGTLITDDLAAYLASTRRCDAVQVSIDGSSPAVHDSCLGKGTFAKAVEGIRLLQKHGVPVAVRVTIHKDNVTDLENIARLLLEDLKLPAFSTNSASSLGLCVKNNGVQLDVDDRSRAMATLVRLNAKCDGRIRALAGPLADAYLWQAMVQACRDNLGPLPGKGHLTACNCPKN
jgi:SynChlorMet cassette radical SAM/SPASM protein ScmE